MSKLSDTKTLQNLMAVYGEKCMSANKYKIYCDISFVQQNMRMYSFFRGLYIHYYNHAKQIFNILHDNMVSIDIEECIQEEEYNYNVLYENFSTIAKSEGLDEVSKLLYEYADISKTHAQQLKQMKIDEQKINNLSSDCLVQCICCGNIISTNSLPDFCCVCGSSKECFAIISNNGCIMN